MTGSDVQLRRELQATDYFALSFGAIVGVGWVVVLGDWLKLAGPLGSMAAFIAGGVVILFVGLCYAEMTSFRPVAGGEVVYAYELFGTAGCFVTGWFLSFGYITTTVFEAVSVVWVASTLTPGIRGPYLYSIHGSPVFLGGISLGLGGMISITTLNYFGIRPAARLQKLLTYLKILIVIAIFLVGLIWGKVSHLDPLFTLVSGKSVWPGMLDVFFTVPFWLAGFNAAVQVTEEKAQRTSVKRIGYMIVLSIIAATVFYSLIILTTSLILPWQTLLNLELPAANAFEVAFHSPLLSRCVLLAALLGNITVWNSNFLSSTRILFALGRARIIPKYFGVTQLHHGAPSNAILFVGALGCSGVLLGKGSILPLVNVTSTCYALGYLVVCVGVMVAHKRGVLMTSSKRMGVVATLGILGSLAILILSLYLPFKDAGFAIPIEWSLLLLWGALGVVVWCVGSKLRHTLTCEQRDAMILQNKTNSWGESPTSNGQ